MKFAIVETKRNDFDRILREMGIKYDVLHHYNLQAWAYEEWSLLDYDALIICSEHTPLPTMLSERAVERLRQFLSSGRSIYLEYADPLTGKEPLIRGINYERLFVTGSHYITQDFEPMQLLDPHQTFYLKANLEQGEEILSLGRVCGTFRVYGPKPEKTNPGLVIIPHEGGWMVYSALELSTFTARRSNLHDDWERLLRRIVLYLIPEEERGIYEERAVVPRIFTEPRSWVTPQDRPTLFVEDVKGPVFVSYLDEECRLEAEGRLFRKQLQLPPGHHKLKVNTGDGKVLWLNLDVASRKEKHLRTLERNMNWFRFSGLMPEPNGKGGVYEQVLSRIDCFGKQPIQEWHRPDCNSQSALAFYLAGKALGRKDLQETGLNIMDYFITHRFQDTNPSHATYGFFSWWEMKLMQKYAEAIYSDDNSWPILALFYLYRQTAKQEYLMRGLMAAEAFLQTHGPLGLGQARMNGVELNEKGRAWYAKQSWGETTAWGGARPHRQANILGAFLYTYGLTGDERYLNMATKGLDYMTPRYLDPSYKHWANTHTSEHAHFLLALSMGYHYSGHERYKNWLIQVADFLISHQVDCGAIQEWDNPTRDTYGTGETGIFHENGEPISDQLYTTSFAALGLLHAFKSTNDKKFLSSFTRLADYLVRIQVESSYKRIDGGWMRAFDYGHWEPHGSSGDIGWGAHSMETGWQNAIIDIAIGFYLLDESFLQPLGKIDTIARDKLEEVRKKF